MNNKINYQPLTRKVTVDGEKIEIRLFEDNNKIIYSCPLHSNMCCIERSMLNALLTQLYTFEQIYMQEDDE